MAFTTSAIESLIQILATGNDFRTTNRVKCQYTGAIEFVKNRENGQYVYNILEKVNFENLDCVKNNRMYKAFDFLRSQGFVYDGGRRVTAQSPKSFIKLVNPETGLVGWFNWEGDVYQYIEGQKVAVLVMKRGKVTPEGEF